jgi:hypothetical protein
MRIRQGELQDSQDGRRPETENGQPTNTRLAVQATLPSRAFLQKLVAGSPVPRFPLRPDTARALAHPTPPQP